MISASHSLSCTRQGLRQSGVLNLEQSYDLADLTSNKERNKIIRYVPLSMLYTANKLQIRLRLGDYGSRSRRDASRG